MGAVNSGLLDVHIKGMLVGNSSTISRNQLPLGGGGGAVAVPQDVKTW